MVTMIVLLTAVPASMRPMSGFPREVEHIAGFFVAGGLYFLGYPRRLLASLAIAFTFAAAIELLQIPLPSRHARLIDFVVDAAAACVGTLFGFLLVYTGRIKMSKSGMTWK